MLTEVIASAVAATPLTDPTAADPIAAAAAWIQASMTGTVATAVAVIAVAVLGLLMLSGRINWRYGAIVVLGCFILFGAGTLAAGLRRGAGVASEGGSDIAPAPTATPTHPAFDPYAGAAPARQ